MVNILKLFTKYIEALQQNHLVEKFENCTCSAYLKGLGQQIVLVAVCLHSYEYTIVDHAGTFGTIENHTESCKTMRHTGSYGTMRNHMGL